VTDTPRGRGRTSRFTTALRQEYLDAIAQGMRLGDAADHVGIHRNVAARATRVEPEFAAALADARAVGKKIRDDQKEHNESRYTNQACRCTRCRTAATAARTCPRWRPGRAGPRPPGRPT
jgi:hypothetical protein